METKAAKDKAHKQDKKAIAKATAAKAAAQAAAHPTTPTAEKVYAVRGNLFEGKVVSAKANKTVTVERELTHYVAKYERYRKIKSRILAHNPTSINAKEGDIVQIGETRRISKTKNFIVIAIIGKAMA